MAKIYGDYTGHKDHYGTSGCGHSVEQMYLQLSCITFSTLCHAYTLYRWNVELIITCKQIIQYKIFLSLPVHT